MIINKVKLTINTANGVGIYIIGSGSGPSIRNDRKLITNVDITYTGTLTSNCRVVSLKDHVGIINSTVLENVSITASSPNGGDIAGIMAYNEACVWYPWKNVYINVSSNTLAITDTFGIQYCYTLEMYNIYIISTHYSMSTNINPALIKVYRSTFIHDINGSSTSFNNDTALSSQFNHCEFINLGGGDAIYTSPTCTSLLGNCRFMGARGGGGTNTVGNSYIDTAGTWSEI